MSAAAPEFTYSGEELDAMAGARRYYGWLGERFAPHLGPRLVEAGAGIGTFTAELLRRRPDAVVTAVEPAANNLPVLERRFGGSARVRVVHGYLDGAVPPASADAVVAVNVMEHVEDDHAFLRAARRALVPGGRLLLFVPALPWLFGTLDEAFEHHRRYTRRGLLAALAAAGLRPVDVRYTNLPGVAAWFLAGRVLRRRTVPATWAGAYDRLVVPWVAALERRFSPPLGQSLLAIATNPPETGK